MQSSLTVLLALSSAPPRPTPPEPFLIMGTFLLLMLGMLFVFVLLPLAIHIWAIVDVSSASNESFGPPWDNSKQQWLMGLALAFFIPFGHVVAPVLWWTQVRAPRKRGEQAGRPFWMSAPPAAPPQGYYGQGQPPQPGPPRGR